MLRGEQNGIIRTILRFRVISISKGTISMSSKMFKLMYQTWKNKKVQKNKLSGRIKAMAEKNEHGKGGHLNEKLGVKN